MQLELNPSNSHLRRILLIRLIMVSCQMVMMWFLRNSVSAELHLYSAAAVLLGLSTYSAFTLWTQNEQSSVSESRLFSQLLIDVVALTAWLYFLGGANNPFISYFLVPICISAALLSSRFTWSLCTLAIIGYSILYFINQPLTDMSHDMHAGHGMAQADNSGFQLHILGMWANFSVSAVLISYFISRMAIAVREQQRKLNELREQQLQNDQLVAIGSLAAGTAHELGTPMNTMLLLIDQLQEQLSDLHGASTNTATETDLKQSEKNIQRLKQQIERCQTILQKLVNTARHSEENEQHSRRALDQYLQETLDQWQLLRPEVSFQLILAACDEAPAANKPPCILVSSQLTQAILNLLNNAADAEAKNITINADWNKTHWCLTIEDFGAGISKDALQQAGSGVIETQKGMGIGLLISNSTVQRMQGELRIENKQQRDASAHGTIVTLKLPLPEKAV